MKLVVTGGAGFIGSNFIIYMLGRDPNCEIICVDALKYSGSRLYLKECPESRMRFIHSDICSYSEMLELLGAEKPDAVINFAAETHVDRSIENAREFLRTNIEGTFSLLEACRNSKVRRFHQISTDEVYGDQSCDEDIRCDEASPLIATNPYAATKASADMLVRSYFHTYGLYTTISRCSNNFGPHQYREKLIPKTILNALREHPIPVYASGNQIRDWIYVEDHCSAVADIVLFGRPGQVYNISAVAPMENLSLVKRILKRLNKSEELITHVADRPGHNFRHSINADKLRSELGWRPKWDFDRALAHTVEWYVENQAFMSGMR